MSAQDKTEQVLRDIHILFSQSEVYDKETNRIIVDKEAALKLLKQLNISIYEMMEEQGLTKQRREAAEREWHRKSEEIIANAGHMAEDVYAGSVLYTDEALRRVQDIMQTAMDSVNEVCQKLSADLATEKANVRRDQIELRSHLEDLRDTDKYMYLIEERNREIQKEKAKEKKEELPSAYAAVKPEIKINAAYFEKAGIPLEEEEAEEKPEEKTESTPAEIKVNLDAEYFRWKDETGENKTEESKSEKHSIFGKFLKGGS